MRFPRVIYAIRHNVTKRVYVGSTSNPKSRIANHICCLKSNTHVNELMQSDYNLFGEDYSVFVLDYSIGLQDRNKEYLWMDILHSRDPEYGYNEREHARKANLHGKMEYRLLTGDAHDPALKHFSDDVQKAFDKYDLDRI